MLYTLDLDAHFVQVPTGTTAWFPLPQFFGDGGAEFLAPVTDGFMTDKNPSLEKQFFNIPVSERKAVIQPHGVLDDASGKSVAVGFHIIRHGNPAYPNLT